MNEIKQNTPKDNQVSARIAFWGTIGLSVILLSASIYFVFFLLQQAHTLINYIGTAIFLVAIAISIASIVLSIRKQQLLGTQLIFFFLNIFGITMSGLFQGRALSGSITILVISTLIIWRLFPSQLKRSYSIVAATGFALIWVIEWFNPTWRIPLVAPEVGPQAIIAFAILLGILAFNPIRQAIAHTIRLKVIFLTTSIVAVATLTIGGYLLYQIYQNTYAATVSGINAENSSHAAEIQSFLDGQKDDVLILSQLSDFVEYFDAKESGQDAAIIESDLNYVKKDFEAVFANNGIYSQIRFIDVTGQEVVKVTADYISPELQNKATRPYFQETIGLPKGSLYLSPLELEQDLGKIVVPYKPVIRYATPVYYGNKLEGVVVANIVAEKLLNDLQNPHHTVMVDGDGYYLFNNQEPQKVWARDLNTGFNFKKDFSSTVATALFAGHEGSFIDQGSVFFYTSITVNQESTPRWFISNEVPQSEISATAIKVLTTGIFILIVLLLAATGIVLYFSNVLTQPLLNLTVVAQEIGQGNFSITANVTSGDEIGVLAKSFNEMSTRLQDLVSTLEQRVAERTRNLELSAEVGRTVSQVRALDVLLRDAAELIRKQFDLYYVQVYLVNQSGTYLELQSGTGQVGEQLVARNHRLRLDTGSINGRAAISKKSVVISDTTNSLSFKANPLLPETRSEMTVPLLLGDKVVGVLDMQSRTAGSLSQDALPAFEALAGQLAIAIQNASLLAETQQARSTVEEQIRKLARTNWREYLDAIHKSEYVGYVFDGKEVVPLANPAEVPLEGSEVFQAPIEITGEFIGSLIVEGQADKKQELINTVAHQVAQQIESLRLLENAERYRLNAEDAARRQTLEGWQEFFRGKQNQGFGFLYDSNQVKPVAAPDVPTESSALNIPIKVRDETMGTVTILDMEQADSSALELVKEIVQRLGTHLENLHLSEQTRERAQREQALRQITSVVRGSTNTESILRTAARELGSMLGRKTIIRLSAPEAQSATDNGKQQSAPENQSLKA